MYGLIVTFFGIAAGALLVYRDAVRLEHLLDKSIVYYALPAVAAVAVFAMQRNNPAKKSRNLRILINIVWFFSCLYSFYTISNLLPALKGDATIIGNYLSTAVLSPFYALCLNVFILMPQASQASLEAGENKNFSETAMTAFQGLLPIALGFSVLVAFFIMFGGAPKTTAPERLPPWTGLEINSVRFVFTAAIWILYILFMGLIKGYRAAGLWSSAAVWTSGFSMLLLIVEFIEMLENFGLGDLVIIAESQAIMGGQFLTAFLFIAVNTAVSLFFSEKS